MLSQNRNSILLDICSMRQYVVVVVQSLSRVQLFATSWTVAHQAPLSMGFPRQEYRSGLPFPSQGDLPDLGIKPESPALAGGFFTTELIGKPHEYIVQIQGNRVTCFNEHKYVLHEYLQSNWQICLGVPIIHVILGNNTNMI